MILSTLLRVARGSKKAIVGVVKKGQKKRTKSKESAKEKQNMENRTVSSKVTSKLKKSGKSVGMRSKPPETSSKPLSSMNFWMVP